VASRLPWGFFVWIGLSAAALGAGCGGSGSNTGQFGGGADGGSSSGGGSGGSSGAGDDGGGDDSTTSSGSGSGATIDASLDINFPDVFGLPDTGNGSGGGSGSSSGGGPACSPNGITCTGNVADICTGGVPSTQTCTGATPNCANGYGCVSCVPGTGTCNGNVGTACNATGTGTVTNTCDPLQGEACQSGTGACSGDCANVGSSYIGCEYYAVTMLNHLIDQTTFYPAVTISNTSTNSATVNIQGGGLTTPITATVAAGALQEIQLPWVKALSCGAGPCTGNNNQPTPPSTEIVTGGAFHIRSTEPVTAYQFNAYQYVISGEYSYTNDASLLIPVNAMTGNYRAASFPTFNNWPGTIAVIGTVAGTAVTVTAPAGTLQASGGIGTSGGMVTLGAGDVLELESALDAPGQTYGADISGTLISATSPVEVFGGHSCIYIPATVAACDHMEQIALPVETLRGDYLVTPPYNKNGGPLQWIKLIGTGGITGAATAHVSFDPPSVSAPQTLDAGTVITLQQVGSAFRVYSTDTPQQSFFVAQYMEGQNNFGNACTGGTAEDCGDPSESVAVATAQYRTSYQFAAPTSYTENWVNVIAPAGATVTVDGTAVSGFAAIGSASGYDWAHVSLASTNNGVHNAASSAPFGIEVYGYGSYTSYMYPGGLNLTRL
jgi:hypothetical protein